MRTIKTSKVVSSKTEHKNGVAMRKNEVGSVLSLVQPLNNANIVDHMIIPQSAIKNHSRVPISGEQKI